MAPDDPDSAQHMTGHGNARFDGIQRVSALPADDPAYGDLLDVLARHGGEPVNARPEIEGGLFNDLLAVVVTDRVRQAGPGDIADFFSSLTPDQRAEFDDIGQDAPPSVWVKSDVSPTGAYIVTIEYTSDHVRSLTPIEVEQYAQAWTMAMHYAEYDAAVLNQLRTKLQPGPDSDRNIAGVLLSMRKNRVMFDHKALKPLIVRPCISERTGEPFLAVRIAGTQVKWRWDPIDVINHVQYVHETIVVADLDAAYRRFLIAHVGLDDDTARSVVADLASFRHPRT